MNSLLNYLPHQSQQIVLQDESSGVSLAQLQENCLRLSREIMQFDSQCIAIKLSNCIAWVVLDIAIMQANRIALPLPPFFSSDQQDYAMEKAGCQVLFTDEPQDNNLLMFRQEIFGRAIYVYKTKIHSPVSIFKQTKKITFTSGSTGQPKGVCLSFESQLAVARSLCTKIDIQAPKHLCILPLAVLLENIAGVYAPLLSGGQVVLLTNEQLGYLGGELNDGQRLLSAIDANQPTSIILVPELLKYLIMACMEGWVPPKSLMFIAIGGAHTDRELLRRAWDMGLPVFQGYGLSEAGSVVCLNSSEYQDGSVGPVLPHIISRCVEGELQIKGPLFLGYLGGAAHNPHSWFATGDLIGESSKSMNGDLNLQILGRKSNLIINSYGRNINPEWPESLLLSKPWLQQAVVFGEAKPFLIALLWVGKDILDEQVSEHIHMINSYLPDYAQVKRWVRLSAPLSLSQGYLTPNCKPKRLQIAQGFRNQILELYN
ncbi:AMP-binding protein [Pseudoalteromonas aurantia]|uniref:AMP-dependent synthetase/ligase domain-containing protein n=1 Tax=Pseudoalteromonas aurantia 208 TaxID=1314867 RepID=A0ABR9EHW3_9GAMM|nr:AMP-binding protein [Pseudoalteromonas aurantia]MBE0370568.1 hypothetical protein [Pseudoalteromonas aurantia 208]